MPTLPTRSCLGMADAGETLAADKLQARYTVTLASWAAMLDELLKVFTQPSPWPEAHFVPFLV